LVYFLHKTTPLPNTLHPDQYLFSRIINPVEYSDIPVEYI